MAASNDAISRVLPALEPFLRDWIETQRRIAGVPGVQVAIRIGERVLFSHAAGYADLAKGEALTTSHAFRIASHSKTFTATAVMREVEAGRLRLDDTVGDVLPELAGAPIGAATVRALLGHFAAVERDGVDASYWQLLRPFPSREELFAELGHDRVFPQNEHFHYSNLAYSLLGHIAAATSGRAFNDLALDMIAPLAEFAGTPLVLGPELGVGDDGVRYASGHSRADAVLLASDDATPMVLPRVDTLAESPATGFWGNAESVSAWLAAHALGTGLFLTDETKRLMQRDEAEIARNGIVRHYGLGWISMQAGDRRLIGHSGGFPGHITQTWGDPQTGLAVSVLTNQNGSPASAMATAIVTLLDEVVALVPDLDAEVVLADIAGHYIDIFGPADFVPLPGVVVRLGSDELNPAAGLVEMHVDDSGQLRAVPQAGFDDAGEVARIVHDEHGVAGVTITGITFMRPDVYLSKREQRRG